LALPQTHAVYFISAVKSGKQSKQAQSRKRKQGKQVQRWKKEARFCTASAMPEKETRFDLKK
jgi:hypothetical protein